MSQPGGLRYRSHTTMQRVTALTLAGALALGLAACGGDDDEGAEQSAPATVTSSDTSPGPADPVPGSTSGATAATDATAPDEPAAGLPAFDPAAELTVALVVGAVSLDPHKTPNTSDVIYGYPIYDRLTKVNDDFEVEPMLATSWEFGEDGSYLQLSLRDDVSFHDGTPFDAQAVKVNIERAKEDDSTTAAALAAVGDVVVVDPVTVKLMLNGGAPELPAVLAGAPGMMVSPAALIDSNRDLANSPGDAGSGPYLAVEFVPSDHATYQPAVPSGEHWDTGAGLLQELTIRYVAAGPQRINAVKAGDIDLGQITSVDVPAGLDLVDSGEFDGRVVTLAAAAQALLLRSTREPLTNLQLRQAIAAAIDKDAIAEGLYQGTCVPTDQFFQRSHWAYSPSTDEVVAYDPERARELVAASGIENPTFELIYYPIYEQPVQVIQAQLAEVGISVELRNLEATEALSGFRKGEFDSAYTTLGSPVIDPTALMRYQYLGGQSLIPEAERAAIEEQVVAASDPTLTQEERRALFDPIFVALTEQAYAVPICHSQQVWLNRGDVGGVERILYTFYGTPDLRYLYRFV